MPVDPARYPSDWKTRSRFVRIVRSRGRCEWCGAQNYQPHPITGSRVVLTAAHVHDKNPMNGSLLNLAALCQRCHLRHDARDKALAAKAKRDAASGQQPLAAQSSCREAVAEAAWASGIPMKEIARRMGLSSTALTRKLRQLPSDSMRFTLDDLERFVQVTGDTSPIVWLVHEYLSGKDDRIAELEAELARLRAATA